MFPSLIIDNGMIEKATERPARWLQSCSCWGASSMNGFVSIIQLNFYFCIFCDIGMNANLIWLICYDVLGLNRNRLF